MKLDLTGLSVFIGIPTHRDIDVNTAISICATLDTCMNRGVNVEIHFHDGSSVVTASRNGVVAAFLKTDHNRLFWIDSDMVWEADDFVKLLAISTELEVVGACYSGKIEPVKICCAPATKHGEKIASNEYGCIERDGFGLGFTCIQRKVIEELADKSEKVALLDKVVPNIFRLDLVESENARKAGVKHEYRGEDLAFFADVRALGYKVWMDPTIRLGHVGKKIYWAAFADLLKKIGDD